MIQSNFWYMLENKTDEYKMETKELRVFQVEYSQMS